MMGGKSFVHFEAHEIELISDYEFGSFVAETY